VSTARARLPMPSSYSRKRRRKLINPPLQLRMIGSFLGLLLVAFVLQSLLFASRLARVASEMPEGGAYLQDRMPDIMVETIFYSVSVLLPLTVGLGVLVTFRIAGPLHNFERFLGRVARGEQVDPCKIRTGDELGELCDAINRATGPLREEAAQRERELEQRLSPPQLRRVV